MSSGGARASGPKRPPEWDRLELAVRRLLDDHEEWRRRAEAAARRVRELDAALRDVTDGALDPVELKRRVEVLETRNAELRQRLDKARESVDRILARLQFLEEDR